MAAAAAGDALSASPKRFAFMFPLASGHINPSLPVSRRLVELGHSVHYLCFEQMREAIEDTGATFHDTLPVQAEFFEGRKPDPFGALVCLMTDNGIEDLTTGFISMANVADELKLPGVLRWLQELQPDAVVFCPLCNREAVLGCKVLNIPAVGLLTVAGVGSCRLFFEEHLEKNGLEESDLDRIIRELEPAQRAIRKLNETYGFNIPAGLPQPFGSLDSVRMSTLTLVTTAEELQDPIPDDLAEAYSDCDFKFVGALLDVAGARRAGTHRTEEGCDQHQTTSSSDAELRAKVRAARQAGRPVVMASMGTVVTGDIAQWGWASRPLGPDGQPRGLSGCELCRAVWGATFDAFAAESESEGPLILISLGPQQDPLGDLVAPPNAICMPSLPQVDILKEGIDLFVTHGGQNSFMESTANAVPVVVCPGFGDQIANSRKAANLGVGLKVERPNPDLDGVEEAISAYRQEVCQSIKEVFQNERFKQTAKELARRLEEAGGVARAVQLVLETTERHQQQLHQRQQRLLGEKQPEELQQLSEKDQPQVLSHAGA